MRDVVGAWLSVLCMVHCAMPLLVLGAAASFGIKLSEEWLHADWLHLVILLPIIALLLLSIPAGYRKHGNISPTIYSVLGVALLVVGIILGGTIETLLTVIGSVIVITAHLLNRKQLGTACQINSQP